MTKGSVSFFAFLLLLFILAISEIKATSEPPEPKRLCEKPSKTWSGKCYNDKCDKQCISWEFALHGACHERESKELCFCYFLCHKKPPKHNPPKDESPPPPDGGSSPPPKDGSSPPPADGGGSSPPPKDKSPPKEKSPPKDKSPPPKDGSPPPPPDGGSSPPPKDGSSPPPADGGSSPPPSKGGSPPCSCPPPKHEKPSQENTK